MKPVELNELLSLARYEEIRDQFRRRIIDLKRVRRVALGSNMTLVFENRDTVLLQVQEMLRTERITRQDAILHELETYNELIPKENELSATIFVEYPDTEERDRMLAALAGMEDKFYMVVDGERSPVRNETRGTRSDRTTAVQYAKFPLSAPAAAKFLQGTPIVHIGIDHPAYQAETELTPRTVEELRADLSDSS